MDIEQTTQLLEATKEKMDVLNREVDELFSATLKRLDVKQGDDATDYIFDYLYNDIDYLDKIKQLLFETENV